MGGGSGGKNKLTTKKIFCLNNIEILQFSQVDTLLESWPWWLFEYLAPSHKSRVLDCFLMEGHKVLFRWPVPLSPLLYCRGSFK